MKSRRGGRSAERQQTEYPTRHSTSARQPPRHKRRGAPQGATGKQEMFMPRSGKLARTRKLAQAPQLSSWPGLSRPSTSFLGWLSKTWITGTSPVTTDEGCLAIPSPAAVIAHVSGRSRAPQTMPGDAPRLVHARPAIDSPETGVRCRWPLGPKPLANIGLPGCCFRATLPRNNTTEAQNKTVARSQYRADAMRRVEGKGKPTRGKGLVRVAETN